MDYIKSLDGKSIKTTLQVDEIRKPFYERSHLDGVMDVIYTSRRDVAPRIRRVATEKTSISYNYDEAS